MNTQEDLNECGFTVIDNVISCETVALLVDELQQLLIVGSRRAGLRNLLTVSPLSRTLANSSFLQSLIKPILGSDVKCVRGLYFDKRREANWKVAWHQDLTIAVNQKSEVSGYGPWSKKAGIVHVQPPAEVLQRMVSRLHLDDADQRNGALVALPGSHRFGILNSRTIDELKRQTASEVCIVKKGSAMLMRPLLVHASSVAVKPTHRRVLHFEYAAGKLDGGLEWQTV